MDWTYPSDADESGIFEIGRRLAQHLGRVPDATRFTYDARDMLRVTRQIESAARGGRLWVGFETAAKLAVERARYEDLVAGGTTITTFGTGARPDGLDGLEHRSLAHDRRRIENQWFLVSDAPEPVAFVSWEISDPALFGVGGAATPGKRFTGFVTDDTAIIAELVRTLEAVNGIEPPASVGPPPAPELGTRAADLLAMVERANVAPSGAPAGAVVVPVGRDGDDDALAWALALARAEGRTLVVVDRSGEGLLASPYGDLRGDDADRPQPDRLFGAGLARREGRGITAAGLEVAAHLRMEAGGWFPTASGAEGLGEALRRFGGSILVVSAAVRRPGFVERLRGMSQERLARLGAVLIVAG